MSELRRMLAGGAVAERWSLQELEGPVVTRKTREEQQKAAEAAAAIAVLQARQEGDQRGYAEGLARAQSETDARLAQLDARIQQLDSVLGFLGKPLQSLDAEVEKDLSVLALAIGKQLARRELRVNPTQVIAIIRESLEQLPSASRDVRVYLHPEDAAAVRERLSTPGGNEQRAWSIVEDPTLTRGGCTIKSDNSQIDARLESRISAVIANIFGDERALARQPVTESNPTPGGES